MVIVSHLVRENICIGYDSGYFISSGSKNICIGTNVGPASNQGTFNNRLYIDSEGTAGGTTKGTTCLIYGDQSGSTHTLKINGDVTMSDDTTNSSGNLTVEGSLTSNGNITATDILTIDGTSGGTLKIRDNNNGQYYSIVHGNLGTNSTINLQINKWFYKTNWS